MKHVIDGYMNSLEYTNIHCNEGVVRRYLSYRFSESVRKGLNFLTGFPIQAEPVDLEH